MEPRITDLSKLKNIAGDNNSDFIRELIDIFLEQVPEFVYSLQVGMENKDYEKLRVTSHKMSTSLGTMGMMDTCETARNIEASSRDNVNLEQVPHWVDSAIKDCMQAIAELKTELDNLK